MGACAVDPVGAHIESGRIDRQVLATGEPLPDEPAATPAR